MSRSYRKPYEVHGYGWRGKKYEKRRASKRIRRTSDVPDGKLYRRFYDPWNIADYRFPMTVGKWWSNWKQEWVETTPEWKARRK